MLVMRILVQIVLKDQMKLLIMVVQVVLSMKLLIIIIVLTGK